MSDEKKITGVYTYMDDCITAVKLAQKSNLKYRIYSPVPNHELEDLTNPGKSPVRYFTGFGAIFGITAGFTLAIWTSLDYPMRVSAKDIVSVPGFVVIGYEWTILFGGIFTLLALLIFCRLPNFFNSKVEHPSFTQDKFGIVVNCESSKAKEIKEELIKIGADEVFII